MPLVTENRQRILKSLQKGKKCNVPHLQPKNLQILTFATEFLVAKVVNLRLIFQSQNLEFATEKISCKIVNKRPNQAWFMVALNQSQKFATEIYLPFACMRQTKLVVNGFCNPIALFHDQKISCNKPIFQSCPTQLKQDEFYQEGTSSFHQKIIFFALFPISG